MPFIRHNWIIVEIWTLFWKDTTSNILMLPYASKSGFINSSEHFLHIITHKYLLNGLGEFNKRKGSEYKSKYDSYFTASKGIIMLSTWKLNWYGTTKNIPPLNVIKYRTPSYGIKFFPKHYYYEDDPKLGQVLVDIRKITCSCHACQTKLFITWDNKIKVAYNNPIYAIVLLYKYSQIINNRNNCIKMNLIDDETDDVEYKHINITILMVMLLTCCWLDTKQFLVLLMPKTHHFTVTTL